ncbi:MAG: type II secretion system F family protein [Candidatus Zipacnadales bacterium]
MAENQPSVTNAEIASMCRQFSSLVHAEVNVLEILEALRAQTSNPHLREILDSVREDLEMGRTLATAFSRYPQTFSPFFISMIRQGELEGELDTILAELATHYESRLDDTPDATRRRGAGTFDIESLATLMTWMLAWVAALLCASALLIGALLYAHRLGAAPGDPIANICILVGAVMFLGVILLARGKRR